MRFRRRKKREVTIRISKKMLIAVEIAALLAASWWGWRTLPEIVRYLRIKRT